MSNGIDLVKKEIGSYKQGETVKPKQFINEDALSKSSKIYKKVI